MFITQAYIQMEVTTDISRSINNDIHILQQWKWSRIVHWYY